MRKITAGDLTLSVAPIGHTAYGRARYRVVLRDDAHADGVGRLVFVSEALELPWQDDARALRDAAGFLAYYATADEDDVPDRGAGVSAAEILELRPYADGLDLLEAELGDGEYVPRCPACGEPIDYCQGHGPMGDPTGARILEQHDDGDHSECHPDGCEER